MKNKERHQYTLGPFRNFKRVGMILVQLPYIYRSRLLFNSLDQITTKREVYYSTVFALSSAALAFSSQYIGKQLSSIWLIIVSNSLFAAVLILVILIHFLQTLYKISYEHYNDRAGKKDMKAIISGKEKIDEVVEASLYDSFALMVITAYLDIILILLLVTAIILYAIFASINL